MYTILRTTFPYFIRITAVTGIVYGMAILNVVMKVLSKTNQEFYCDLLSYIIKWMLSVRKERDYAIEEAHKLVIT